MARIRQKTLVYPGLNNTYTFPVEADDFASGTACVKGKYYIYSGDLYRCDVAHTGAWNADHFTAVKLGNELSDLHSTVDYIYAILPTKTLTDQAIASFDDGADNVPVKALVVDVNPVQDLHGYDNPWPGRSGKNILNPTGESGTSSGFTVTKNSDGKYVASGTNSSSSATAILVGEFSAKAGVEYTLSGCPANGGVSSYRLDVRSSASTLYKNECIDHGSGVSFTVDEDATLYVYMRFAGNYAITDSLTFSPMIRLASITDGTFVPYSNECPITGHTGCEVPRTGKNLLNLVESEMISDGWNREFPISIKAGTYILSCENTFGAESSKGARVLLINADGETICSLTSSYDFGKTDFSGTAITITAEEALRIARIKFELTAGSVTFSQIASGNIQLELGSTATTYEPYSGTTYPISWQTEAGTVHSGFINVTTGELTADKTIVDMSTLEVSYDSTYDFFTITPTGIKTPVPAYSDIVASCYACNAGIPDADMATAAAGIYVVLSNGTLKIKDTRYTTKAEFQAGNEGQTLLYPLATPQTYQLDPVEVRTLLGINNIWADTGNINTLTYRADLGLYIQNIIDNG